MLNAKEKRKNFCVSFQENMPLKLEQVEEIEMFILWSIGIQSNSLKFNFIVASEDCFRLPSVRRTDVCSNAIRFLAFNWNWITCKL